MPVSRTAPRTGARSTVRSSTLAAVALALTMSACAGSNGASIADTATGGDTSATLDAEAPDRLAAPADAEAGGDAASAGRAAGGVDLVAATAGRQIISSAHVDLTVPDAGEAAQAVGALVAEAGGFISGEETSRVDGTRTTLVLRVPPAEFASVLDALAELGELTSQRIETDEVTDQVVDLESRITTAEASVGRLRDLLGRSGDVAEIAAVETELLARETTLETLRGQLRTIERQVDLATVTVTIDSDDGAPVVDAGDEDRPSFLTGLAGGWDALVLTLAAAGAVVGALLPWLALLALLGLPLWRLLRSRRRTVAAGPAPG